MIGVPVSGQQQLSTIVSKDTLSGEQMETSMFWLFWFYEKTSSLPKKDKNPLVNAESS